MSEPSDRYKDKTMKNYRQILKFGIYAVLIGFGMQSQAIAATSVSKFTNLTAKLTSVQNAELIKLAAVDLPQILPYIMKSGDVFQGYEIVTYKNKRAFKLRIFNQRTGRVRYVYVDQESGRVL